MLSNRGAISGYQNHETLYVAADEADLESL